MVYFVLDTTIQDSISSINRDDMIIICILIIYTLVLIWLLHAGVNNCIRWHKSRMIHERYIQNDEDLGDNLDRSLKRVSPIYLVKSMIYVVQSMMGHQSSSVTIPYQCDAFVNRDDAIAFLGQRVKAINEDNDNDPEQKLVVNPHLPYMYANQDEIVWMTEVPMFERRGG